MKKSKGFLSLLEKIVLIGASILPFTNNTQAQNPIITYNPVNPCASGTTIYTEWKDRDGDNYPSWGEFKEENKTEYPRNGKINLMIHLARNENPGGVTKLVLTSPQNAKIIRDMRLVQGSDSWTWVVVDTARLYDATDSGPGQYKVDFFVNDNYYQTRWFNLVDDGTSVRPFTCNFMPDKEYRREGIRLIENAVGLNKRTFRKSESVCVGAELSYHQGKRGEIKLLNPRGEEIKNYFHDIQSINYTFWYKKTAQELSEKGGSGTYSAHFYIDNKKFAKIDFDIVD